MEQLITISGASTQHRGKGGGHVPAAAKRAAHARSGKHASAGMGNTTYKETQMTTYAAIQRKPMSAKFDIINGDGEAIAILFLEPGAEIKWPITLDRPHCIDDGDYRPVPKDVVAAAFGLTDDGDVPDVVKNIPHSFPRPQWSRENQGRTW